MPRRRPRIRGRRCSASFRSSPRQASAKHDLFDAMGAAGIDFKARCGAKLEEMKECIGLLLTRAQEAGAVRRDTSVDELIGLVVGSCQAAAQAGLDDDGHPAHGGDRLRRDPHDRSDPRPDGESLIGSPPSLANPRRRTRLSLTLGGSRRLTDAGPLARHEGVERGP